MIQNNGSMPLVRAKCGYGKQRSKPEVIKEAGSKYPIIYPFPYDVPNFVKGDASMTVGFGVNFHHQAMDE